MKRSALAQTEARATRTPGSDGKEGAPGKEGPEGKQGPSGVVSVANLNLTASSSPNDPLAFRGETERVTFDAHTTATATASLAGAPSSWPTETDDVRGAARGRPSHVVRAFVAD